VASSPASPLQALLRGARRRCPRCGEGALFERWFTMRERCASCDLVFEPTAGDTWGFWVLMDRMFLLAAMVLLFFGFRPETWEGRTLFLLGVAIPLVATMPHRQGIAIALDWIVRSRSS
jgi:uncharacterized protein (DUF983 family)